ncbi:MAG: acyltransferase [Bacteroidales bacterium]|jgi:surface polysaccharide O-acyltransferase-like enzyme|nr:acyltransferase [Bacteroidales bacterium]
MTKYLSDKIKILSATAILLVLYIHSGFHADEIAGMTLNGQIQAVISEMLGRCAVPLFYVISGYLFFLNISLNNGLQSIIAKMKKRVRTLLVPYLIAAVFFPIFFLVLNYVPGVEQFMNGNLSSLFAKPWYKILYEVFFMADNGLPVTIQLWFLRDLILIVAVSPLLYYLYKYLYWWWLPVIFAVNYLTKSDFFIYGLLWFGTGGVFSALKKNSIHHRHGIFKYVSINTKFVKTILIITFLILCILQLFSAELPIWKYFRIPIIMLGIVTIWLMYDMVFNCRGEKNFAPAMKLFCGFTFFIYLFHEPTLNVVRKLLVFVIGKTSAGYLVSYLISPWIFMMAAIIVGMMLKKYLPRFYGVLVGGR